MEGETQITIPESTLLKWVDQISKGLEPTVKFSTDEGQMRSDAYEIRGHILAYLNAEMRSRLPHDAGRATNDPPAIKVSNLTPRAKTVLALAGRISKDNGHSYIGAEHILLGLLRLHDGPARRILEMSGVDVEDLNEKANQAAQKSWS